MNDIGNRDLRVDHKNVVLRHNFHQLIAPSDDTAHGEDLHGAAKVLTITAQTVFKWLQRGRLTGQ